MIDYSVGYIRELNIFILYKINCETDIQSCNIILLLPYINKNK
jgi:hypothetical protein